MRSKESGIFETQAELSPTKVTRVESMTILPELFNTRGRLLRQRVEESGAENHRSRRLLEMYSNEAVLKVAS